jgi:hypothetical protein
MRATVDMARLKRRGPARSGTRLANLRWVSTASVTKSPTISRGRLAFDRCLGLGRHMDGSARVRDHSVEIPAAVARR